MQTIGLIFFVLLVVTILGRGYKRDSTDDPTGSRSGLVLYTDHATGVQYVGTAFGGITPRVALDGKLYSDHQ